MVFFFFLSKSKNLWLELPLTLWVFFFFVTIIDGFDEICILIMIYKLDSKLISKTKKKKK